MMTISQKQNEKEQLERLAAQRWLYSQAKKVRGLHLFLAMPCVIGFSILVYLYPEMKVYGAYWGVVVTLLDLWFLQDLQRERHKKAAKIQEMFDCDVLQLAWNDFRLGKKTDYEDIFAFSKKYMKYYKDFSNLSNWYSPVVDKVPIHFGRLVCQRSNLWWDAKLRSMYKSSIVFTLVVITIFVFLLGILHGLSLENLLLVVITPLMPIYVFGIREYKANSHSVATLIRLKSYVENLWEIINKKKISVDELNIASRDLQDAIYDHRCQSPLLFDWLYKIQKKGHQTQMERGAEDLVNELLTMK